MQAPQPPSPHPNLVPQSPKSFLKNCSKVLLGSGFFSFNFCPAKDILKLIELIVYNNELLDWSFNCLKSTIYCFIFLSTYAIFYPGYKLVFIAQLLIGLCFHWVSSINHDDIEGGGWLTICPYFVLHKPYLIFIHKKLITWFIDAPFLYVIIFYV